MSYQALDPEKTAVLFFDMLNRYHTTDEPLVLNCVRLRDAADDHGIPVFFARADHRPDGKDAVILYSDLNRVHEPWKDPENDRSKPYRANLAGQWGSRVIDERGAGPVDYMIPRHRKNAFFQTRPDRR